MHFRIPAIIAFMLALVLSAADAARAGQWSRPYGGTGVDSAASIQQTAEGGFIVAGSSTSFGGGYGAWVMKLNADGLVGASYPGTWQMTYGDTGTDIANSVQQTADGGYIVAGCTSSFGVTGFDAWVLKLDASGGVAWQKTYGGAGTDCANSVRQTADGGYVLGGYTNSFGAAGVDFWVLKLDANGDVGPGFSGTWQRIYGGSGDDLANAVQQTADGGYIVAGRTNSFGASNINVWVLRLDAYGAVLWQKTYDGVFGDDDAKAVLQTADGGYIVAGSAATPLADTNAWILKLDANGNVGPSYAGTWQRSVGTSGTNDSANSIQMTSDGGYIVGGGYSTDSSSMFLDAWFVKLDASGGILWQKTYGAANDDVIYSVQQTVDGGYVAAGVTTSQGLWGNDAWILRTDLNGNIIGCTGVTRGSPPDTSYSTLAAVADSALTTAASNATAVAHTKAPVASTASTFSLACAHDPPTLTWMKSFGGSNLDMATSVRQTSDGGFIVAGDSASFGTGDSDAWVMKLDQNGNVGPSYAGTWQKAYVQSGDDHATSVQELAGGGYVVSGYTATGPGSAHYWIMWLLTDGSLSQVVNFGSQAVGDGIERANDIQRTGDGGLVAVGTTSPFLSSNSEGWLLKLNSNGTFWRKSYGGSGSDGFASVQQTADGGFIVVGNYQNTGSLDTWVLKLDSAGSVQWQKTYGKSAYYSVVRSVRQTGDGGYIFAGTLGVTFGKAWVVKLDADGAVVWQHSFGDSTDVWASSVRQAADGGYVVTGWSHPILGGDDTAWIMKLTADGSPAWKRGYGGTGPAGADAVNYFLASEQTEDGGYVVAGYTNMIGAGSYDGWLLKLDPNGNVSENAGCESVALAWPAPLATSVTVGDSAVTPVSFTPLIPPVNYLPAATAVSATQSQICSADNRRYTLEVLRGGLGTGRITSSPSGIDCGASCAWSFASPTSVGLTALADYGATFTGWSGACSGGGAASVTANADKVCIATFTTPVDFGASPLLGHAPLTVVFSDLTSPVPVGWSWDFGDGGSASVRNPTHVFIDPGLYNVSLAASLSGLPAGPVRAAKTDYISVAPCPQLPARSNSSIVTQYDSTISGAFNRLLPYITLQAARFTEDVVFSSGFTRTVSLSGAYDCDFYFRVGRPSLINGSLTVGARVTLTVENIEIY